MGIKIRDIAYVRFSAPDLDQMEMFLTEFGMVRAERTNDALYMRGLDGDAFLHVTHKGEPRFVAAGFEAASRRDLEELREKKKQRSVGWSGDGALLKLTDPNGFQVEVVAARTGCPNRAAGASPLNDAYATPRLNALAPAKGPSYVKRLGHCVLNVKNFRESEAWYKSRFGLITSDEINLGAEQALGASTMRSRRIRATTTLCFCWELASPDSIMRF
jgi:catechol 2,3-dioxygenase-like lactoylglutathione lyase family enzyme